jgi:hypothetical protein
MHDLESIARNNDAYYKGCLAFFHDKGRDNPYPEAQTEYRRYWFNGYDDSMAKANKPKSG